MTPSHRGRALAVIAGGSSAGTPPRQALAGYLAVRRSLGYKLDRPEKLLAQFISYLEDAGAATVTTDHALAWATLPGGTRTGTPTSWPWPGASQSTCTPSTHPPKCRQPG